MADISTLVDDIFEKHRDSLAASENGLYREKFNDPWINGALKILICASLENSALEDLTAGVCRILEERQRSFDAREVKVEIATLLAMGSYLLQDTSE